MFTHCPLASCCCNETVTLVPVMVPMFTDTHAITVSAGQFAALVLPFVVRDVNASE